MTTPTVKYYDGAAWQTMTHVRSYSYTSGRQNETSGVSPGVATLVLDNSDSTFVGVGVNLLPKSTPIQILVGAYPRFTGFVDASPVTFPDPEGTASFVTVACVDALAMLQRHQCKTSLLETLMSTWASIGSPTTAGYWPMSDAVGSIAAAEAFGGGVFSAAIMPPNTNTPLFGVTGPGVLQPTAMQASNGVLLQARCPAFSFTNGVTVGGWFKNSNVSNVSDIANIGAATFGQNSVLSVSINGPAGAIVATAAWFSTPLSNSATLTYNTGRATDGVWHSAYATITSGGVLTLYVDDAPAASTTVPGWTPATGLTGLMDVGGSSVVSNPPQAAHVFCFPAVVTPATVAGSQSLGSATSTSGLAQLASWGAPGVAQSFDTQNTGIPSPAAGITVAGNDCLALAQVFAKSEDGPLFVKRDGTIANLTHDTLTDRATGAATAAFVNGDAEPDLTLARDAQFLVTKCEITPLSGSGTAQVVSNNLSRFGLYDDQESLYLTDYAALDYANWHIATFSDVNYGRISQFSVDLLNSVDIQATALALDVGSRATLSGLPPQGGFTSADLLIQGFTEDWDINHWRIAFNTTPSSNYVGWILEDPVYGLLDTTTVLYY